MFTEILDYTQYMHVCIVCKYSLRLIDVMETWTGFIFISQFMVRLQILISFFLTEKTIKIRWWKGDRRLCPSERRMISRILSMEMMIRFNRTDVHGLHRFMDHSEPLIKGEII